MRTISPFEFVRRLHHGVTNHDGRYVWFLGAGCSVSSGIGDAAATVMRWLRELKYLETGDNRGVEGWAGERFPQFDPDDPAALYSDVLHALFYTAQEKERELERINAAAEPGFGYATLAQLVTQAAWGERCNTIVTTNFDDLAADALYLYSQQKPQVLTHESFDRRIRISTSRPTILKIYGDAHLGHPGGDDDAPMLRSDVKDRLRAQFTEAALIFVGYGGRDESVRDLLEGLPQGAPAGGVFWVNEQPPRSPLRDWLEDRNTICTPYGDFEGLMFLLRREFKLGHPRIDRFDQILRRYDEQFRTLAARSDLTREADAGWATPVARVASRQRETDFTSEAPPPLSADAPETGYTDAAGGDWRMSFGGDGGYSREDVIGELDHDPDPVAPAMLPRNVAELRRRDEAGILAPSRTAMSRGMGGASAAIARAPHYDAEDRPEGRIDVLIAAAVEAMAQEQAQPSRDAESRAEPCREDTRPPLELVTRVETAEDEDEELVEIEADAPQMAAPTEVLPHSRDDAEIEPQDAPVDALETAPQTWNTDPLPPDSADTDIEEVLELVGDGAAEEDSLPRHIEVADTEDAEADSDVLELSTLEEAASEPQDDPDDAPPDLASEQYETAPPASDVEIDPDLAPPTRLLPRSDAMALDRRFRAALQDAPNNARLLARYAQFLAVGRRDHDGAEHYFNRAFDADPRDSRILRDFAGFLTTVRRDFDRAEDCYRLALRADFENAELLCDYAQFLWRARRDIEAAGECFQVAVDAAPRNATVLAAYAVFLDEVEGKSDAAYAMLKLASASTTTDPKPVLQLARFVDEVRQDRAKAEAAYRRAVAIAPDSAPTIAEVASFLSQRAERQDEAAEMFQQALAADPDSPKVLRSYAQFQSRVRNDIDEAEALLRRALDADPGDARTALVFARFEEEERQDFETADEYYRRAVHLDPRDADILASHARFLHRVRSNPAAAEDRYRKALKLEPKNARVLASLGNFLLTERNAPAAAEPLLREAVELNPHDADALSDLGRLLRDKGDAEGAEDAFSRAIAADPRRVATLRRYARFVNTARSNPEAAEEFYRRALSDSPNDPATLCGAAQAMFSLGRRDDGLSLLDRAFEAALSKEPRDRDPDLLLELWFYRYAFDDRAGSDSIKAALWLVRAGARVKRSDLDAVLSIAISQDHAAPDRLAKLAAVICGEAAPDQLKASDAS